MTCIVLGEPFALWPRVCFYFGRRGSKTVRPIVSQGLAWRNTLSVKLCPLHTPPPVKQSLADSRPLGQQIGPCPANAGGPSQNISISSGISMLFAQNVRHARRPGGRNTSVPPGGGCIEIHRAGTFDSSHFRRNPPIHGCGPERDIAPLSGWLQVPGSRSTGRICGHA